MLTQPCPRAGLPGCRGIITARDAGVIARRRHCSNPCAAHARVARGIVAPVQTRAFYQAAGKIGGAVAGVNRRKRAALTAAAEVKRLIPADLLAQVSDVDARRILALLVRVWLRGHTAGKSAGRMRQREAA